MPSRAPVGGRRLFQGAGDELRVADAARRDRTNRETLACPIAAQRFPDEVMAAALIDRLVHHCHIVNIRGNSYRMKDHQNLLQSGSDRRRKRAAA